MKKKSNNSNKTELKEEQDKIVKLQAFDSSYLRGKSYFGKDDLQNYLVFQSFYNFKKISNSNHISTIKPKRLSNEFIKHPDESNNSFSLAFMSWY